MVRGWWVVALVVVGGLVAVASGPKETTPVSMPSPTQTPSPTPAQGFLFLPMPGGGTQAGYLFPPGPGRELVFYYCGGCHGLNVILFAGPMKNPINWGATLSLHRKVHMREAVTDEEYEALSQYLIGNFGPHMPPLEIPPEYRVGWAAY